eukprot:4285496-Alexandrium_andersonii.AAC.1
MTAERERTPRPTQPAQPPEPQPDEPRMLTSHCACGAEIRWSSSAVHMANARGSVICMARA